MDEPRAVEPQFLERMRLEVDICKHLMTLCTGAIVIIATLLEKLISKPIHKGWVIASVVLFVVSLIASTVNITSMVWHTAPIDAELPGWIALISFLTAVVTFCVGIMALGAFAAVNL